MIIFYYFLYRVFSKLQDKNEKVLKWVIFISSFVILIIWNLYAQVRLYSDYKTLFEAAGEIVKGNIKELTHNLASCFYYWNFQIGYAGFLSLIMRIFGSNLWIFKILEIIYLSWLLMMLN